MKGFPKNTVFILLGVAGLVLTAPSQTNIPVRQVYTRFCSFPADAGINTKTRKELPVGNHISFEEARFVSACW